MEYTAENMRRTVMKIKEDENLSWKQMAELFGFKTANAVNQYATGSKVYSPKAFRRHFGPIEQYWKNDVKKPEAEQVKAVVEEKPAEKPLKREEGIVLSCQTVAELVKLLDIIGYRMEVIKSK